MKNLNVEFLSSISINSEKVLFNQRDQIVFVGRSNVGKSSLLNAIFQKKDLVKTSSKPWKTKTANVFLVNKKYEYVDLPWYWFAKWWLSLREDLDNLISWYLEEFKPYIKKLCIVVDAKIWPTVDDVDMYKYVLDLWLDVVIVINKIDKPRQSEINMTLKHSKESFFGVEIFQVSARNNNWIDNLSRYLLDSIKK